MKNEFCYLKGIVDCDSGTIQDCNNKRATTCPLDQNKKKQKENKKESKKEKKQMFCYLKGIVDCDAGRIQDCNIKRVTECMLEQKDKPKAKQPDKKKQTQKEQPKQSFCYLKGLVSCSAGRVQDCNIKRVEVCPKE